MEVDNEIDIEEKQTLLLACGGGGSNLPKPDCNWLTDVSWARICVLDKLGKGPWINFAKNFRSSLGGWKGVFDSDKPLAAPWPGGFKASMTPLQRALVILAVRTDCTITGMQEVISAKLGSQFLEPPAFDLEGSFNDSTACTPLIFV